MFTGIVEETGRIESIVETPGTIKLAVFALIAGQGAAVGDSTAVNGCCLTVTQVEPRADGFLLHFDLLRETWNRTSFQQLAVGSAVNLERSLPANGRLHGHFVTGHIDGVGMVKSFARVGADWKLLVEAPPEILHYLIFKGAIAVDGISLTLAEVNESGFAIWIIPHTCEVTNLRDKKTGSLVNIEADMLAKYAEKFLLAPRV